MDRRKTYMPSATASWVVPTATALGFVAGDTNLSRYVGNNTLSATDPSGRAANSIAFAQQVYNNHGWINGFKSGDGGGFGFTQLLITKPYKFDDYGGAAAAVAWGFTQGKKPAVPVTNKIPGPDEIDNYIAVEDAINKYRTKDNKLNGQIIQLVTFDYDIKNDDGTVKKKETDQTYESWSVRNGQVFVGNSSGVAFVDTFSTGNEGGKLTNGTIKISGFVMFVPNYQQDANWINPGTDGHLKQTASLPNLPRGMDPGQGWDPDRTIGRIMVAKWCDSKDQTTNLPTDVSKSEGFVTAGG